MVDIDLHRLFASTVIHAHIMFDFDVLLGYTCRWGGCGDTQTSHPDPILSYPFDTLPTSTQIHLSKSGG